MKSTVLKMATALADLACEIGVDVESMAEDGIKGEVFTLMQEARKSLQLALAALKRPVLAIASPCVEECENG